MPRADCGSRGGGLLPKGEWLCGNEHSAKSPTHRRRPLGSYQLRPIERPGPSTNGVLAEFVASRAGLGRKLLESVTDEEGASPLDAVDTAEMELADFVANFGRLR